MRAAVPRLCRAAPCFPAARAVWCGLWPRLCSSVSKPSAVCGLGQSLVRPCCLQGCLRRVLTEALQPVETLAQQLAAAAGQPFLGIDASLAPALEPPSIPAAYELLGLGRFGGAGTLAISGARHRRLPGTLPGTGACRHWAGAALWHDASTSLHCVAGSAARTWPGHAGCTLAGAAGGPAAERQTGCPASRKRCRAAAPPPPPQSASPRPSRACRCG